MNYFLIALAAATAWYGVKLMYKIVEEIVFARLHTRNWYAVLCKREPRPFEIVRKEKIKAKKDYRETTIGFKAG